MELGDLDEQWPAELRLALMYTHRAKRTMLATYFALDRRLGQIVANTNETMLGQMRLAWWRDMLALPASERPKGDAVLDAIGAHWKGHEAQLSELIDAWEVLFVSEGLTQQECMEFAQGRAAPCQALVAETATRERVLQAAQSWAIADAAAKTSDEAERHALVELGLEISGTRGGVPRQLRGLAVLEALAVRALELGGLPLMEGREAALVALRVGLIGR